MIGRDSAVRMGAKRQIMVEIVNTPRLVLRPLQDSDAEPLFALLANWSVVQFLATPPWPYSIDDARSFIDRHRRLATSERALAITLNGRLIGCIGLPTRQAGRTQRASGPHLAYWLGVPHWGRGYATEAARGLLSHAFETLEGDTIYSGVFTENSASMHVQRKLGFVHDGETTLYSRPRGAELPHTNTSLTRAGFEAVCRYHHALRKSPTCLAKSAKIG